jgi:hypothetical protein
MKFAKEELEMLIEGYPPHIVRDGWDCATIVPELAKIALDMERLPYPENKPNLVSIEEREE